MKGLSKVSNTAIHRYFRSNSHLVSLSNQQRRTFVLKRKALQTKTIPNLLLSSLRSDASKSQDLTELSFKDVVEWSRGSHVFAAAPHGSQSHHQMVESAEYVRKQLIILMARNIIDFQNLPYGVGQIHRIEEIMQSYIDSYTAIKQIPIIKSTQAKQDFDETSQQHLASWAQQTVVPSICLGLLEMHSLRKIEECPYLSSFINRIITRRLAQKFLIGHYMALHDNKWGILEQNCDSIHHIERAKNDALMLAQKVYQNSASALPQITIRDQRTKDIDGSIPPFIFYGQMIHQFCFELIKNSIRATMEYHDGQSVENEIKIFVVNSEDGEVSIKISDKGGGISRDDMNKVWLYSYRQSTNRRWDNKDSVSQMELLPDLTEIDELSTYGLGYGLPLVRAYSAYFGGSCNLQSLVGYGTDAYLFLPTLATSKSNVLSMH